MSAVRLAFEPAHQRAQHGQLFIQLFGRVPVVVVVEHAAVRRQAQVLFGPIEHAQPGAPFALCGALSGQIGGTDGDHPRLALMRAIAKQLTFRGFATFDTEEQLAAGAQGIPWKRMGTPQEIGKLVAFMMNDDCDYMTGSTVVMDGGICLPWWSGRSEGKQ